MKGQHIGYIRVSSMGQHTGRQLEGVQVDRSFTETEAATTELRQRVRSGASKGTLVRKFGPIIGNNFSCACRSQTV